MKPHNEDLACKVKRWIEYADEDLRLAEDTMTILSKHRPPYRLIAYHSQQCAEKYLKAFLVFRCVDFPYTHNISILLELCSEHGDWPAKLKDAEELTAYAITTRYPGESEQVTKTDAGRTIEIAQQVQNLVKAELKKLGLDLSE
jgi:HEPN domain-containing protein